MKTVETINGAKDFATSFAGGVYSATKQPLLVVEAADLEGLKSKIGAGARRPYHDFLLDYRVRCSYDLTAVVFTAASLAELAANKWLVPAISAVRRGTNASGRRGRASAPVRGAPRAQQLAAPRVLPQGGTFFLRLPAPEAPTGAAPPIWRR